jgi:hypothetical protein
MPDSFGKRQRRESKERKAAARAERKQARRANPEAFRGWEDVPGAVPPVADDEASRPSEREPDEASSVPADGEPGSG